MGLAPFRGLSWIMEERLAGVRGNDDLRSDWSGFTSDGLMDMRVSGGFSHRCAACGPALFRPDIFPTSGVDVRRAYIFVSHPDAGDVPSPAGWDSWALAHGIIDREGLQSIYRFSRARENIGLDALPESADVPDKVPALDNVENILWYLRSRGLDDLAGDLEYKKFLIEEEPDESPISLESAREFAGFVATEPLAGSPGVMVDSYGYVGLEWIIPDPLDSRPGAEAMATGKVHDRVWGRGDGVLGMWFLPSGLVRVYGTSGPVGQGIERMLVNSVVPPAHVMVAVEPFLSRLESS